MGDVERLNDELAIATLVEEYEALRPTAEDASTRTPEVMARYRELNDQISKARREFKEKYPPPAPVGGDAAATPETASVGVVDISGGEEG